jgi:UDPglucose 6-dehydrogenase
MKVGIVGMGVVGSAIYEGLESKGHEVYANDVRDIEYVVNPLDFLVSTCEVIFICVPTPQKEGGVCDLSIVYKVFNDLHYHLAQKMREEAMDLPVIAIKSTVIPGTADSLIKMYPRVCSNPEFMTEKNPLRDFLNPDRIILGAKSQVVIDTMVKLYNDFDAPRHIVEPAEAEAIKYLSNSLLLTKVAFSQEISRLCQMLRLNARLVYDGITADKRINPSHLDPTKGRVSIHTPCLAKDMRALIEQLDKSGYDSILLKSAYATAIDGVALRPALKIVEEI